jgi:pyruvate/2-oxoglutarate dehydrogenase complex dihydrolipoamide acyltransferase (E2) component
VSSSRIDGELLEVTMPQMGVSVAEGTIVEWKKGPGDPVEADEPIVEISTDKVETEVPAPGAGRLKEVLVQAGETVDVGTVLATIEPVGAEASVPAAGAGDGGAPEQGDGRAPPVTPVVRRMAEEHDLDLSQIEGSGRRGRVTKKDVLAYLRGREERAPEEAAPPLHMESPYREEALAEAAPAEAAPAEAAPAEAAPAPPGARELSVMRKRIAEHMVRSLRTAAHCTTIVEADMSRIEAARGRRSYLPFVARATIAALREHPSLNATLDGDMLTVHEEVHLGIAVSLGEQGLIVPVIRNAHELSHEGLATRIKDLAERARDKRLSPDEVGGGTFTITNPGAYGALLATPIINQPQVAILDLEAVVKRPVVVTDADGGDSIAIRPMTYLCMSWDHRALDGAMAAQFLSTLKRRIEAWQG